jgi:hypothetical protein
MRVLSACEYLMHGDRKPDHFTPYQIVQAVKGKPFNGYAWLTVGGAQQRLESSNPQVAVSWAAEKLGEQVFAEYEGEMLTIVPVPGHTHVNMQDVEAGSVHRLGLALAEALRQRGMVAYAFPLLHWNTAIQSAREGGSRDPDVLQQQLRVVTAQHVRKIILVDDMVTSGGHIVAAHAVLTAARHDVADVAFAVGRTVYVKGDPLGTLVEECPRPMTDSAS